MKRHLLPLLCATLLFSACSDLAFNPPPVPQPTIPVGTEMLTTTFTAETTEPLVNPERGFYKGLNLLSSSAATSAASARSAGFTLVIGLVKLDAYRAKPLDATLLAGLDNGFKAARSGGVKVILRFMYNSDGTADAPLSVILGHIKQLTPLVRAHADVIYAWQGGFIGGWGEWHGSTNGLDNDTSRKAITDAMLTALPATRQIQLRRATFKQALYPVGTTGATRVGLHNDCFLASETDQGTYTRPVEPLLVYSEEVGRTTAIGGETCKPFPPRSACVSAQAEMRRLHYTYMNSQYHMDVLNGWRTEGCYDEVERELGYRLFVRQAAQSVNNIPGGVAYLQLHIANSGYASLVNARPAYLLLQNGDLKRAVKLRTDPRTWAPGVNVVTERLRLSTAVEPGTWTVTLVLPDAAPSLANDSRYSVRLANERATAAGFVVGEIVVRALTPEQKAAMDFAVL